jgi:hypothetical protein
MGTQLVIGEPSLRRRYGLVPAGLALRACRRVHTDSANKAVRRSSRHVTSVPHRDLDGRRFGTNSSEFRSLGGVAFGNPARAARGSSEMQPRPSLARVRTHYYRSAQWAMVIPSPRREET